MIRRLVAVALALLAITSTALVGAASASADPYPPSNPTSLSASAYDPCAGASNVIGGTGFATGETVRLVLSGNGVIGTAVVRADGTFQVTVTIPLSARGSGQVTATGLSSGRSAGLTLAFPCIVGQSAGAGRINSGGGLAYTGVAVGAFLLAVALLIGTGSALVVAGRRRRAVTPASR